MYEDLIKTIKGYDSVDKRYLARCIRELKRWNAPLSGWVCVEITDVMEDDDEAGFSECELCGCKKVRYEHHMEHYKFPLPVVTGCICAGIMSGDILKAQEDERQVRNRSKRRRHFATKKWKQTSWGAYTRRYKYQDILIAETNGLYTVRVGDTAVSKYKGRPIDNLLSAGYAAFDIIDPPKR